MFSEEEALELKMLLDEFRVLELYERFLKAGVTTELVFDLDEDLLKEMGLDKVEILKFNKARSKYNKKPLMSSINESTPNYEAKDKGEIMFKKYC